jgi:hypothetical protein
VRKVSDVGLKFVSSMSNFLSDAVTGCGIRLESVVTSENSSVVLSLMATYGSRLLEFCVKQQLLVFSTKHWPFYVDSRIISVLRRLNKSIDVAHKHKFERNVRICFSIFSIGLISFRFALKK